MTSVEHGFSYHFKIDADVPDDISELLNDMLGNLQSSVLELVSKTVAIQKAKETVLIDTLHFAWHIDRIKRDNQRLKDAVARTVLNPANTVREINDAPNPQGTNQFLREPVPQNQFPQGNYIPMPDNTMANLELRRVPPTPVIDARTSARFVMNEVVESHTEAVHGIAVSQNNIVASASWDGTVALYDLNQKKSLGKLAHDQFEEASEGRCGLYAVKFAETNPNLLACASNQKLGFVWDYQSRSVNKVLRGHILEVNSLSFHPTQQVMCTCSDDGTAFVWDLQQGVILRRMYQHGKEVYDITFLGRQNEYALATCCYDRTTRVFDMRDRSIVAQVYGHTDDVIGIAFSEAENQLATTSDDGTIIIYDSRMWTKLRTFDTKPIITQLHQSVGPITNQLKRCAYSNSGKYIAAGCSSGAVVVYDATALDHAATLTGHSELVFGVAWTPDGDLVTGSHDKTWRLWQRCP